MEFPMDPKTFALLVAILFFFISLLVNLLQRRYSKSRIDRLLNQGESALNSLTGLDTALGKLESACTLELDGTSSPKELGRSIRIARNQIQSTMADIQKNLRSFRQYRQKEKARERHQKRLEKLRKKRLEK
jgi:hypothetical protein